MPATPRSNGIYDTQGRSIGYFTTSPSGTANILTHSGKRAGYQPQREPANPPAHCGPGIN